MEVRRTIARAAVGTGIGLHFRDWPALACLRDCSAHLVYARSSL